MPAPSLHAQIDTLAHDFTDAVLTAIRSAPLEELFGPPAAVLRRPAPTASKSENPVPWSRRTRATGGATLGDGTTHPRTRAGRLSRRTPAEIAATLVRIVALVKKTTGMRSEEIREALGLDVREMPRALKEGLAKKVLKSRGQKRATTYSAA